VNPDTIARQELIGLDIVVEQSSNPSQVGIRGLVVDETRNTFLIESDHGVLQVQKRSASFIFIVPEIGRVRIRGSILLSQPENRISKRMQKLRWKL
jgi:ribonuclease P protein subunit POP4